MIDSERSQIVRFRLVSLPGQQVAFDFLRNSSLRVSLDSEGEVVRREDRYLVIGYNDVRDGGG